ncbi:MAG: ATP-binding protein [Acidimicrobiales bacterium]
MAREFQVDLRGVVELLARHVYSSPRVFVRELLQNGVDAVTARRMQDPTAPLGPVLLQPADAGGAGALVVSDPGIGITIDEVHELLATVGASSKGAIDGEPTGFLGRFGVGLLSCFVIAERIEVVSRSASGAPPIRWTGQDDGTYEVQELSVDDPAAPSSPGTRVRLDPRPDMAEWVGAAMVELLAATFGAALRVPVLVERADGTQVQLSDPDPPWRTGSRVAAAQAWSERHLGFTPMAVLPISIPSLGIEGSAFVPPEEAHPTNRGGAHVYLSGMLLGEDVPDVVPEWAFFVRVVIDGDGLHPTASRESLVDDEALAAAIGEQVRAWMLALTQADPDLLTASARSTSAPPRPWRRDLVAFAELAPGCRSRRATGC